MAYTIYNPRPGDKFPSPVEKSGYWTVPKGCTCVVIAEPTGYPITHVVRGSTRRRKRP